MNRRGVGSGLLGLAVAFGAGSASAQDVQIFKPAVGTWNYLSVEGAGTAEGGQLVPSLYVHYARNPLVLRDADDEVIDEIIGSLTTLDVMAAYGFTDRLELGVALPVHFVSGDLAPEEGTGLGDVRVTPKVRLLGETFEPGFGLALSAPVHIPTGDENKLVGAETLSVNPRLIAEIRFALVSAAANVGFRWRPDREQIGTVELGSEITYGAGAAVELGSPRYVAMAEVFGVAPAEDIRPDSDSSPLEGVAGVRIFTDAGPVFTLGAGRGLIPDYGSPDYRVIAGFAWHERDFGDRDGDGRPDEADRCPDDPEDRDGFEDEDGCPDPDNDGDGLLDADDRCPNEPETRNGFEDEDGCPDVGDRDGDGLKDDVDACPEEAEDADGFEDENGCPDPDNDRDGIPDGEDECPLEPEVINGVEDEDGCPDVGASKVRVTREKIEILEQVYFEHDKATIKPQSYSVLNQVASTLKAHPEITKVRVEGHTDRWGTDEYNMRLSQARANAVVDYLVGRGIDRARLEPVGYGESRPQVPYTQPDAYARNRRVEFVIVEQDFVEGAAPPAPEPAEGRTGEEPEAPAGEGEEAPAPVENEVSAGEGEAASTDDGEEAPAGNGEDAPADEEADDAGGESAPADDDADDGTAPVGGEADDE